MKKVMVLLFFVLLMFPNMAGSMVFSESVNLENRILAEFPQISEDNWEEIPGVVESYINDHAPFRYEILNTYAEFNWNMFGAVDSRDVIRGKDGWLFYRGNGSMTDVLGINIFSEEVMELLLGKLLEIRENYVDDPEQFILFIAPNKEQVYRQYMPNCYEIAFDTSTAQAFTAYIREHSDIKVVYPLEDLKEASQYTQVYYKTDTHWNRLGGFVGTQCLIEAMGGAKTDLESAEVLWEAQIYRGDQANLIHIPDIYVDDHDVDIRNYLEDTNLCIEKAGNLFKSHGESAPDKRSLMMVRDSFGVNMMPYLSRYFEDTEIIHYNDISQMDRESLKKDVFIYEIVERYLGDLPGRLDDVLKIKTQ